MTTPPTGITNDPQELVIWLLICFILVLLSIMGIMFKSSVGKISSWGESVNEIKSDLKSALVNFINQKERTDKLERDMHKGFSEQRERVDRLEAETLRGLSKSEKMIEKNTEKVDRLGVKITDKLDKISDQVTENTKDIAVVKESGCALRDQHRKD